MGAYSPDTAGCGGIGDLFVPQQQPSDNKTWEPVTTTRWESPSRTPVKDYNHVRLHSALGMMSPADYERSLTGKDAA
jgi:hypothetical protein